MSLDFPTIAVRDDDGKTYHRVYMCNFNGTYKIFLGDYFKREFTDETLPDAIKTMVGLINAYEWPDTGDHVHKSSIMWKFREDYPEVMFFVGWRDQEHYCLVLSDDLFRELRGQPIRKSLTLSDDKRGGNDTRSQSQSQGKESSQ